MHHIARVKSLGILHMSSERLNGLVRSREIQRSSMTKSIAVHLLLLTVTHVLICKYRQHPEAVEMTLWLPRHTNQYV
jgi:hypothetical protein